MEIRRGDILTVEEAADYPLVTEGRRRPDRLIVMSEVIWLTSDTVTVRLPESEVWIEQERFRLPATRRRLPRLVEAVDWLQGGLSAQEPMEWVGHPFYPALDGRRLTTEKATYYRAQAWASQQRLLYEAASGKPDGASDTTPSPGQLARLRPLAAAAALLGLEALPDHRAILEAYRRRTKQDHPDGGGDAQLFKQLVEARDLLLAEFSEGID